MFGEIVESGFNDKFDRRAGQSLLETEVPFPVVRFAAGEHDCFDGAAELAHKVGRGQFDDAPNSTGAQVVVDDDEIQNA